MTNRKEIYKCEICGNIVEVLHKGSGELVCCNKVMILQEERKTDQGGEKHLPVIDIKDEYVEVKVGDIAHPMEEEHYIEWIELNIDEKSYREFLNPGNKTVVRFKKPEAYKEIYARSYCNVHGLWGGR